MCNQQVPQLTLQLAVLMQVKEFVKNNQSFSIHDITSAVRSKAENGEIEIPEVETSGTSFRYNIPHLKVKSIFKDMWGSGVFDPDFTLDQNFNGTYFVYTPNAVNNGVNYVPTPTPTVPIVTPPTTVTNNPPTSLVAPIQKLYKSEVLIRVKLYLDHCSDKNFRPTIKQVQSAIKRDVSTGWTCEELESLIETDLGYAVVSDPDYVSASQVSTV